jgi:hypothetical protein
MMNILKKGLGVGVGGWGINFYSLVVGIIPRENFILFSNIVKD